MQNMVMTVRKSRSLLAWISTATGSVFLALSGVVAGVHLATSVWIAAAGAILIVPVGFWHISERKMRIKLRRVITMALAFAIVLGSSYLQSRLQPSQAADQPQRRDSTVIGNRNQVIEGNTGSIEIDNSSHLSKGMEGGKEE